MSADGSVDLVWGDGNHKFRLGIGELRELQEKLNERRVRIGAAPIGPMALLNALRSADVWPDDVRDFIRLALRGGGMGDVDAIKMMGRHFDPNPMHRDHALAAFTILAAAALGDRNDPVGSKKKTDQPSTQTAPSDSPKSTDRLQ